MPSFAQLRAPESRSAVRPLPVEVPSPATPTHALPRLPTGVGRRVRACVARGRLTRLACPGSVRASPFQVHRQADWKPSRVCAVPRRPGRLGCSHVLCGPSDADAHVDEHSACS
jgi:hypothetical protein